MNTIYVFCNCCHAPDWHEAIAIGDDGTTLAGHVCSHHGFIKGDMGVTSKLKHEHYEAAFPDGFSVEYVEQENVKSHPGIAAAMERVKAMTDSEWEAIQAQRSERMKAVKP